LVAGLLVLTRFLQTTIHSNAVRLHVLLAVVETNLSGKLLALVQHISTGNAMAGYIAGSIVIGASTVFSFVDHKKVTFGAQAADGTGGCRA
jgi:putative flippase GtrA